MGYERMSKRTLPAVLLASAPRFLINEVILFSDRFLFPRLRGNICPWISSSRSQAPLNLSTAYHPHADGQTDESTRSSSNISESSPVTIKTTGIVSSLKLHSITTTHFILSFTLLPFSPTLVTTLGAFKSSNQPPLLPMSLTRCTLLFRFSTYTGSVPTTSLL